MKMRIPAGVLVFALVFCLALSGCGESTVKLSTDESVIVIETQNTEESSGDYTDFAARLFKACHKEGKNTLVAPLSVTLALAMLSEGAEGETLQEMEEVLGMELSELRSFAYSCMYRKNGDNKLSVANSLWVNSREDFSVNEEFLEMNTDYHKADVFTTPFSDRTVKEINAWADEKTDGMIPEALEKLDEDSVMCLVNALLFDADWAVPYNENCVSEGEFTASDGTKQKTEFLFGTEGVYLSDKKATGFLKYYEGFDYGFAALLPNEEVDAYEYINSLSGESIKALLTDYEETTVHTSMPKFETDFGESLNEILIDMGMKSAYNENEADFSKLGTYEGGNIYLGEVSHKTKITVGEKGTKAGAVTVEYIRATGAPLEIKEVSLDRPFVYMLVDMENKMPVFIGVLNSVEG